MSEDQRFWAKVAKTDACWLWTAAKDQYGYGLFSSTSKMGAHRWAYERLVGPIPKGLVIDHLCRTRACVNPAHMEAVTNKENILRGESLSAQRGRQTHCKYGHEFTPENTYVRPGGHRDCRVCLRRRDQKRKARRRLAA